MNDRIRQLAEQAYLYQEHDTFLIAALENFAELIVVECLGAISAKKITDAPTEYEQGYNKALKSAHSDIVGKFRVKE